MSKGKIVGPRKKPLISIFLPNLRPGGAEIVHIALANAWLEYGADVEFVLMKKSGELLSKIPETVKIQELGVSRIRGSVIPLIRYLRSSKPDVLVAAMWPLTVTAVLALKMSGVKSLCVLSEHTMLSEAYRSKGRAHHLMMRLTTAWAYRAADAVVAVSKAVADDLATLSGLPGTRFSIVYNPAARGVRLSSLELKSSRPDSLTILTVGKLKKSKNHPLLIRAFKILSATVYAQLVIVGEGSMREEIEELVSELGLTDRVLLPGFTDDPYPYYQRSDLFVLSADYEGFGNVLVEALECGLPIVSTDCKGGPREILNNGEFGELVPPGDELALARAMERALQNAPLPEKQNCRAQLYTLDQAANQYYSLFGLNPSNSSNDGRHERPLS